MKNKKKRVYSRILCVRAYSPFLVFRPTFTPLLSILSAKKRQSILSAVTLSLSRPLFEATFSSSFSLLFSLLFSPHSHRQSCPSCHGLVPRALPVRTCLTPGPRRRHLFQIVCLDFPDHQGRKHHSKTSLLLIYLCGAALYFERVAILSQLLLIVRLGCDLSLLRSRQCLAHTFPLLSLSLYLSILSPLSGWTAFIIPVLRCHICPIPRLPLCSRPVQSLLEIPFVPVCPSCPLHNVTRRLRTRERALHESV